MFTQRKINKIEQKLAGIQSRIESWEGITKSGGDRTNRVLPDWAWEKIFDLRAQRAELKQKLIQLNKSLITKLERKLK